MSDPSLVAQLIAAGVCFTAYFARQLARKSSSELAAAVEAMLSGAGAVGGAKLCYLVASQRLSQLSSLAAHSGNSALALSGEDFVFIFLGGFAVVWISIASVVRLLR